MRHYAFLGIIDYMLMDFLSNLVFVISLKGPLYSQNLLVQVVASLTGWLLMKHGMSFGYDVLAVVTVPLGLYYDRNFPHYSAAGRMATLSDGFGGEFFCC